jgi:DNA repair protein RecO (recombination protein O)
MFRTSTTEAIVLRKVRVGEIHKALTLLTPDAGLLSVMAHGAFKIGSRFGTVSEPFTIIRAYLYHDPVKNQYKLTDAECLRALEGIRHSVARFYVASLWAEVVLKSYAAGGSFASLYRLLAEALVLLEGELEAGLTALSVQVLFRFLELSGQRPELEHCALCGTAHEEHSRSYLSREEGAFVCSACATPGSLSLPAGSRRYLLGTLSLPLSQAVRVRLEDEALRSLKEAAYFLVQSGLETGLNAIRSGAGIL